MSGPPSLSERFALRLGRWIDGARASALRRSLQACGTGVSIHWPVVVNGPDHLRLGDHVSINAFVHIWAQAGVTIGDHTLIASHVAITSLTHEKGSPRYSETLVGKPVTIGKNVWIGAHAVILPGVSIGDGAIVGAGAVVTKDVAAASVVVGVPARVVPNDS